MSKKIFFKAHEFYDDIKSLREKGVFRGVNVGFYSLDPYYTRKKGHCTYLYSSPFSGKTEFAIELALNTSVKYGHKHALYSPESGTKEELVGDLVFKITGKHLYSKHPNAIDDKLLEAALTFIEEHFLFIDPDVHQNDGDQYENALLTVEEFYKCVREAEIFYKWNIDETIIDPFNELTHDFKQDAGRQDLYIERILGMVRRDARRYNRHNTIVTHVVDQDIQQKDTIRYYPEATPRELAGGQAWFRKGEMMISMWRPPVGLKHEDGRPYEENEIHIIIQKFKPRYCGKKGRVILFFDTEIGRYYELINGQKYYAFQYEKTAKQLSEKGIMLF